MRNLTDFAIRHEHERIKDLRDRLIEIRNRINRDDFRPKIDILLCNNTERGGRPNIDAIVMLRCLFIQQLYSLLDEQLERESVDCISFRMFLGTTGVVPDFAMVWKFREHLADSEVDKKMWNELRKQLDAIKLKVKTGIMQNASFITSAPGHAQSDTPCEEDAKTRRSKDGIWAKKGTKSCRRKPQKPRLPCAPKYSPSCKITARFAIALAKRRRSPCSLIEGDLGPRL